MCSEAASDFCSSRAARFAEGDLALDHAVAGRPRERPRRGGVLVAGVGERAADGGHALVGRTRREHVAAAQRRLDHLLEGLSVALPERPALSLAVV